MIRPMATERFLERINEDISRNPSTLVDTEKLVRSILKHLMELLNTRQGNTPCCPDYGLPDFNSMIARFPDAIVELRREIKRCIEKFEPRLQRVKVVYSKDDENPLTLRYEISAMLVIDDNETSICFETTLNSAGQVSVKG